MRSNAIRLLTGALTVAFVLIGASGLEPDATRVRDLFERRCSRCHSLDRVKAAPPLRSVFGRAVASAPQFPIYSDALKQSHITWDEVTLDKWLTDPDSFIPGNDMPFRVENAAERADIIA